MISLEHRAIICASSKLSRLKTLEALLSDRFGKQYVIEIAENSLEVMDLIASLRDIGVETGVIVTDDRIGDMDGCGLAELIEKRYPEIKVVLMTSRSDLDYAQKIFNSNRVYALAKWPLVEEHFVQLVDNACRQYGTDKELGNLLTRLRVSEEEKRLILDSISEAIVFVDMDRKVQWKNLVATRDFFSKSSNQEEAAVVLNKLCDYDTFNRIFEEPSISEMDVHIGERTHFARYFPVYDKDKVAVGTVMTFLDVTDKRKVADMNNSLLEMSRYINHGDALVLVYNKAFGLIDKYFDVKLMCITGEDYDSDYVEYYGEHSRNMPQEQVDALLKSIKKIVANNEDQETILMHNQMGSILAYPMYGRLLLVVLEGEMTSADPGLNYINTIAEHVKLGILKTENNRKMLYQANHDSLTGLFSRTYFMKRLKGHLFSNRKRHQVAGFYSLAVLDLNYFKDVNDNLSHLVGDEVLLEIAQRLKSASREGDIVARIGGDEFAVLFQTGHRQEIQGMIERLQRSIAAPISVDDIGISIGSSFGIVYDISAYKSVDELLTDADQAMYEAKKDKSGCGSYVFYEKHIQNRVIQQRYMEQLLKKADFTHELKLSYQPIVQLSDMSVVGYEGYARWSAEDGHEYTPGDFISIANESGDIHRIGKRVVDLAMDSLTALEKADQRGRYMTINLSSNQLLHDEDIRHIKRQLAKKSIGNNRLHIDMTDNLKRSQLDRVTRNIQDLKDYGVRIEMDDFSRGDVGLGIINRLGVDELKIDRETVKDINSSREARDLTRSILSVAKSLDMKVTAEGVEKEAELKTLKELGCDYAQGYYFMAPDTLESALRYHA